MYVMSISGDSYNSKCLQPSAKHGGSSIVVWGYISASGVGDFVKLDGIMKVELYC